MFRAGMKVVKVRGMGRWQSGSGARGVGDGGRVVWVLKAWVMVRGRWQRQAYSLGMGRRLVRVS